MKDLAVEKQLMHEFLKEAEDIFRDFETTLLGAKNFSPLVYFCDDEDDIREMLLDSFPKSWTVESFAGGRELLERFQIRVPHLMITDLKMPKMTGHELIAKVRESQAQLPLIAISGHAGRDELIKLMTAGVSYFFEKPFVISELVAAAEKALRKSQEEQTRLELARLAARSLQPFSRISSLMARANPSADQRSRIEQLELRLSSLQQLSLLACS